MGKFHHKALRAQVAAKLLTEQVCDVGLIVNHQNQDTHVGPRFFSWDFSWTLLVLGRTILNSVNSPGLVSTSIVPPCCLTMMSWLIERPSPVPSPAGLVVKNGLNIFSLTSAGMPVPLSRIRISTVSPRLLVVALTTGSKSEPPFSVLRLVTA